MKENTTTKSAVEADYKIIRKVMEDGEKVDEKGKLVNEWNSTDLGLEAAKSPKGKDGSAVRIAYVTNATIPGLTQSEATKHHWRLAKYDIQYALSTALRNCPSDKTAVEWFGTEPSKDGKEFYTLELDEEITFVRNGLYEPKRQSAGDKKAQAFEAQKETNLEMAAMMAGVEVEDLDEAIAEKAVEFARKTVYGS